MCHLSVINVKNRRVLDKCQLDEREVNVEMDEKEEEEEEKEEMLEDLDRKNGNL